MHVVLSYVEAMGYNTLNRPFLRGRGAAADTLDGSARPLGYGVRNHVPPRASITKKNTRKKMHVVLSYVDPMG